MLFSLYSGLRLYSDSRLHFFVGLTLSLLLFSAASTTALAQNSPPVVAHHIKPSEPPQALVEQTLSLQRAIAMTLANNPQLHQFKIKKEGLVARRESGEQRPIVNVVIGVENFAGSGELTGTQAAETTVALSSVIELGGKRRARISAADAQLQLFDSRRQAFSLDILGELTSTYIQALEVQERIALAKEARDLSSDTLTIVKNRSQQGAAPESEVKRAMVALRQAQLYVDAQQHQQQRLLIKLAAYWGEISPNWQYLAGDLYAFGEVPDYATLYERAQTSPTITVFANEARLKKAEVSLAKSHSIADLGWQLGVRRFEDTGDTAFTAGVSVPVFSGRRNRGSVKTAMAAENEVEYERQTALLKLHVQLFDAYSQRQQHVAAVTAFRTTILPDLDVALAATQRAYETGRYSYQDWTAAQKELLDAKRALIDNAAAASLNQAVIEQLIGEPLLTSQSFR